MTLRVFISYRRDDTAGYAGRLHDSLLSRLGSAEIFMDVDDIVPGAEFTTAISEAVATCDVMLALIGTRWTTAGTATGGRRLDDPDDYVVAEIGAALERQVRVIPLLVDGARVPHAAELPERIQGLSRRNGFALDAVSWTRDLDALLATLGGHGPPSAEHNPADPESMTTTRARRPVNVASPRRALAPRPTMSVFLVVVIAAVAIGITLLVGGGSGGNVPVPVAGPAPGGSDGRQFREPAGIAVGGDGTVYIADTRNSRILKVHPDHRVEPYAGPGPDSDGYGDGGPADQAAFAGPRGLAVHDGTLYVADYYHERVRAIAASGTITTVAGDGQPGFDGDSGDALRARLRQPAAVAVASDGTLYIADQRNHRIRRVGTDGRIITVAGDGQAGFTGDGGPASAASLNEPMGVALSPDGAVLYVADTGNNRIRHVDLSTMQITTLAGGDEATFRGEGVEAGGARLNRPQGLAVSADGSLYIADTRDNRLRKITNGIITTVAGIGGNPGFAGDDGPATKATLNQAEGVAVSADGAIVYVADTGNNRVRQVADGTIRTLARAG